MKGGQPYYVYNSDIKIQDLLIDRAKVQNPQESRIPHEVQLIVEKKFINSLFTFGQEIVENQH